MRPARALLAAGLVAALYALPAGPRPVGHVFCIDLSQPEVGVLVGCPALTLTVTAPGTVVRGADASFSLSVRNAGQVWSFGRSWLRATMPAGLELVRAAGDGWACAAGPALDCERDDELAPGASFPPLDITVSVGLDAPDALSVVFCLGGPGPASSRTVSVQVTSVADVTLSVVASAAEVGPGQSVTFSLRVLNRGPSGATDVRVVDALPAGATLVSMPAGCSRQGDVVTCVIGDLGPGEGRVIDLVMEAAPGVMRDEAWVGDQGHGAVEALVTVRQPPALPVPASPAPARAQPALAPEVIPVVAVAPAPVVAVAPVPAIAVTPAPRARPTPLPALVAVSSTGRTAPFRLALLVVIAGLGGGSALRLARRR